MAERRTEEGTFLLPTNASLLERCGKNDQRAWAQLVNRYERLVYAIPLKEGLDPDEAADVVQYTFTELLRCRDAILEPERLAGWLAMVCRREVWRSKSKSRPVVELRDDAVEPVPDFAEPYAAAAALYDAIHSLGDPCRSLILGLFFDPQEPDYASIAAEIGRPLGSIGPMRGRCLDRLRQALEAVAVDA